MEKEIAETYSTDRESKVCKMSGADEYVYCISWTLNRAGKHNTKSGGPFFSKKTAKSTHHNARESAWKIQ